MKKPKDDLPCKSPTNCIDPSTSKSACKSNNVFPNKKSSDQKLDSLKLEEHDEFPNEKDIACVLLKAETQSNISLRDDITAESDKINTESKGISSQKHI